MQGFFLCEYFPRFLLVAPNLPDQSFRRREFFFCPKPLDEPHRDILTVKISGKIKKMRLDTALIPVEGGIASDVGDADLFLPAFKNNTHRVGAVRWAGLAFRRQQVRRRKSQSPPALVAVDDDSRTSPAESSTRIRVLETVSPAWERSGTFST